MLTRTGALRATLYDPAVDAHGGLRIAAAVGVNGDVADKAGRAARGRRRLPRRRHRARPPGPDGRGAAARSARSSPTVPVVAGNVVSAEGTRDADRGRRRHRQGRRRPGRDVHHPDDDRRRPAAVLRRAGVRRAAAAELGKHVWADGGVRHPRDVALALAAGASSVMIGSWFAGTHESPGDLLAGRRRPRVQGVLRDGLGPRGRQPDRRPSRRTTGPARASTRRASRPRGCTSTRPARASRTSSTRSARASAPPARTPAPRSLAELHERALVGVAVGRRVPRGPAARHQLVRVGCRNHRLTGDFCASTAKFRCRSANSPVNR